MSTPTLDVESCLLPGEVQVGTANGPGIYVAPPGTAPPSTVRDDYEAPWACLGFLSEDGPTVGQSTDSESLTPWQSAVPIKTIITNREVTLQFVMWQLSPRTLAMYFDTDVPETDNGDIDLEVSAESAGHEYAVSIDSRDGNRVLRVTFTRASLSDAGDMAISRGAVVPLDVTLSALVGEGGSLTRVQLGAANTALPASASANGTGVAPAAAAAAGTHASPPRGGAGSRRSAADAA